MKKNIAFWCASGVHYYNLELFRTILESFIRAFESASSYAGEVALAKRLLDFILSEEEYFNA